MSPVSGAIGLLGVSGVAGTVVGAAIPMSSLYTSGQENRGVLNTAVHLAGATAVGGAVGYGANLGLLALASKIAK